MVHKENAAFHMVFPSRSCQEMSHLIRSAAAAAESGNWRMKPCCATQNLQRTLTCSMPKTKASLHDVLLPMSSVKESTLPKKKKKVWLHHTTDVEKKKWASEGRAPVTVASIYIYLYLYMCVLVSGWGILVWSSNCLAENKTTCRIKTELVARKTESSNAWSQCRKGYSLF